MYILQNHLHAIKVAFYFSLIHSIREFWQCTEYSRESLELKWNIRFAKSDLDHTFAIALSTTIFRSSNK